MNAMDTVTECDYIETDWKQQTRSDQIRPDWGIWARPWYMDQTTYEPDQSTQTMSHGPDQTRPKYTDHVTWTRPDQTRPDQTRSDQTRPDQTRPDQTRPDQTRSDQIRPDQTRLKYTDQNQSRYTRSGYTRDY